MVGKGVTQNEIDGAEVGICLCKGNRRAAKGVSIFCPWRVATQLYVPCCQKPNESGGEVVFIDGSNVFVTGGEIVM